MILRDSEKSVSNKAAQIKLLLLDVDGVLTDGHLYYGNSGEEVKAFSTLDGHGIKMLMEAGVDVGIITGRRSELVARRAAELGIELLYQDCRDKAGALEEILRSKAITADEVAYIGDDFPDLAVLRRVGLSVAVPNGHAIVRDTALATTAAAGGSGAVREVCDFILQAQGNFQRFL